MDKIKVLYVQTKRIKKNAKVKTMGDMIEMIAPDVYEFIYVYCKDDVMGTVRELRPEIVFLPNHKSVDALELIREIKSLYPMTAIFIMLSDMEDDDQEVIDRFHAVGAYKCCFSTLSMDALVHDMYVALNLE